MVSKHGWRCWEIPKNMEVEFAGKTIELEAFPLPCWIMMGVKKGTRDWAWPKYGLWNFMSQTSNEHRSNIKNWFQKNWPFHAIPIFAFITETWKWATFQAEKALAWGDLLWSACQAEGLCVAVCVHAPDDVLVLALEWFWLKLQESGILTPCPGKQRAVLRIANSPGAGWMYGCMDVWMYDDLRICTEMIWFKTCWIAVLVDFGGHSTEHHRFPFLDHPGDWDPSPFGRLAVWVWITYPLVN